MLERNQVEQDLLFDPEDLQSAWQEQGKLFFKYSQIASDTERDYLSAKLELETIESKLTIQVRKEFSFNDVKATESLISAKVKTSTSYINAKNECDKLKCEMDLSKSVLEALKQRKDMIIQISKQQIAEFERLNDSRFINSKKC